MRPYCACFFPLQPSNTVYQRVSDFLLTPLTSVGCISLRWANSVGKVCVKGPLLSVPRTCTGRCFALSSPCNTQPQKVGEWTMVMCQSHVIERESPESGLERPTVLLSGSLTTTVSNIAKQTKFTLADDDARNRGISPTPVR